MSTLKSVLKCWVEFNLPSLQKSLDQSANETVERQETSEKGKKALIKLIKEWKASTTDEARTAAGPIIKAFQKEIDALNKRCKFSESSFLNLYKSLLEIPDPVPALKKSETIKKQLVKMKDLELENEELRGTLADYHSEFADVKNQEVTLNKLKEKLKEYEDQSEQKLSSLVGEKEKELEKMFEEREQQLLDSKLDLATKLGDTELQVKTLKNEIEQFNSDMFQLKSNHEDELIGRISEIEILESDLERANQQLLTAEKFSEAFKTQFQQDFHTSELDNDQHIEVDNEMIRALEFQLLSKERELSDLMEEVHHQQTIADKHKRVSENEIASLDALLDNKTKIIEELTKKIEKQKDYDEIYRQLHVLKLIEFSGLDDDRENSVGKPLEKLLLEKNKSLHTECTKYKVQYSEVSEKYVKLQAQQTQSRRTIDEQKELITQLEKDVLQMQRLPSSIYRGEGVGAPSTATTELMTKAVDHFDVDEVDEFDKQTAESLLPIVSSQRERFRTKNLELQSKSQNQDRQITMLQGELNAVRQDNVKLYEKIKFLQSYPTKGNATVTIDDDSVQRYGSSYEERIDPFSVFSRKEKQQRYVNLSTPEKVTLNLGRFILSNKIARTLAFFYTILLHLLVFIVLYKFAYNTESCRQAMAPVLAQQSFGNLEVSQLEKGAPKGKLINVDKLKD